MLFALVAIAEPALAGRVLFIGDSRFNTGAATRIPTLVQNSRTDITHCVDSRNGRNTIDALAVIEAAIVTCGQVTDVVIMLGINDLLLKGQKVTSAGIAIRLRGIADRAALTGARAWIVTEPPGPLAWGGVIDARRFVRDTRNELYQLKGAGMEHELIDAHDEFIVLHWYSAGISNDQLHPTGLAGRQAIAAAIAAALP
ncbi:MAG: SGNH/GDSL hydrolase family protein [Candidatus Binatia bacterium]